MPSDFAVELGYFGVEVADRRGVPLAKLPDSSHEVESQGSDLARDARLDVRRPLVIDYKLLDVDFGKVTVRFQHCEIERLVCVLRGLLSRRLCLDKCEDLLANFDALVANRERTRFSRALLEQLPNLRIIAQTGNHVYHIDLEATEERGIIVAKATGGGCTSAAELAIGLMIAVCVKSLPSIRRSNGADGRRR